jgi:hypothetical protein
MGKEMTPQAAMVPVERPEALVGATYKIKPPTSEHALYVTINDIVVDEGTPQEQQRPFEMLVNSKNMDHFQWVVALTRMISLVFRTASTPEGQKSIDLTKLVEELRSVFDPRGGYFKRGGKYAASIVAEIGDCIEQHLVYIGLLQKPELDEHQQKLIAEKRAQYEARTGKAAPKAGASI